MVEGPAYFLPPSQQVASFCYLYAHAVQLWLEVGVLEGLEIEEPGLVELPFAWTLLQSIGDLLSDLFVLLDHVIHVDIFGLWLTDLRDGQPLPVHKQMREVRAEVLTGLSSETLL